MKQPPRKRGNSLSRIFKAPSVLACIIGFGLLSALFGDGLWNVLSWIAMSVPLAVIAYHMLKTADEPY